MFNLHKDLLNQDMNSHQELKNVFDLMYILLKFWQFLIL